MGKRKSKAKRSLASLPKGLPTKRNGVNPFEVTKRQRRPKHDVLNRFKPTQNVKNQSKLAESVARRQAALRANLQASKKTNAFVDRRIGESTPGVSQEEQMLARLVRERSRRSKRVSKYALDDDGDDQPILTHKGIAINDMDVRDHVILSSDEEDGGNLDEVDTELHFGGMASKTSPYGMTGQADMSQVYQSRKTELDDMINRRKIQKVEKMQQKEKQVEAFESMDEGFKELSKLLRFRDKEKERTEHLVKKRKGQLTQDEQEMADWDKEMKSYLFERRIKATDRTKTSEEIAKEEADRLQELETRRLARMNGDFNDDDFSDISDDEDQRSKNKSSIRRKKSNGPEDLGGFEEENEADQLRVRFTADGLVYIDGDGNVVKRMGDDDGDDNDGLVSPNDARQGGDESDSDDDYDVTAVLQVGTRVKGNYRVKEQYDGHASWYKGKVTQVNKTSGGKVTYNVEYDDGDFEDNMEPENVRPIKKTLEERTRESEERKEMQALKQKQQKAKDKARNEIPFVFEVPTTIEALHEMIGNHAATGADVSVIIQRIHSSNSVRLDKRNTEKMQNFYDVLLRRFIAVGDAIYSSGDGGPELSRYEQLNALTQTLYSMAQDSPESAGAVWGRRLGILQNAHAKRLRDAEFIDGEEEGQEDEDISAWPSTGTIMLLRAMGHIFPVTDLRHYVLTPAMLLLGQILAQTPVRSVGDLTFGVACAGLMIEFTKDAKRISPEAVSFLAGILHLFGITQRPRAPVPTLRYASVGNLRKELSKCERLGPPRFSFERDDIQEQSSAAAVLCSALHLINVCVKNLGHSIGDSEKELFSVVLDALHVFQPHSTINRVPDFITTEIIKTQNNIIRVIKSARRPLSRRVGLTRAEIATKSLVPRMEDPSRYSMSKDKGKSAKQAAADRMRREYKREHKAVSRELRLDAAFSEKERRKNQETRDNKARAKRYKNFAWLEGEQATMNQQVRQGGGLLSGGGMGAARAKVKSAKMGIKRGGKF